MASGWTIEVGIAGGALASQRWLDQGFDLGLNQMDSFHATIITRGTPTRGDDVKIWWDKGGPNERLWLRAQVTQAVQDKTNATRWRISGYGDLFPIFQSTLGGLRDYGAATPWAILQQAGPPAGLLVNAQGAQVMNAGTTAPNALSGGAPGNAFIFRAHTGNMLLNIARLCEQATFGGGPQYGIEFFVDRDGGDARRFNLVSKRQRSGMVAESFQIGPDFHFAPGETNLDNDYNRVKVVGTGSGRVRVESAWVGAGNRELVFEDKNIADVMTAANLANRILAALNSGSSERQEAETYRPNMVTQVGDDVSVVPRGGGAPSTLRCFGINYEWSRKTYRLELGRQRRFFDSYLRDGVRRDDGDGVHAQITDNVRRPRRQCLNDSRTFQPKAGTGVTVDIALASTFTTDEIDGVLILLDIAGATGDDYAWQLTFLTAAGAVINASNPEIEDWRKGLNVGALAWAGAAVAGNQVQIPYYIPFSEFTAGQTAGKIRVAFASNSPGAGVALTVITTVIAELQHQHNA